MKPVPPVTKVSMRSDPPLVVAEKGGGELSR